MTLLQVRVVLLGSECSAHLRAATEQERQLSSDSLSVRQQLSRIASESWIEAQKPCLRTQHRDGTSKQSLRIHAVRTMLQYLGRPFLRASMGASVSCSSRICRYDSLFISYFPLTFLHVWQSGQRPWSWRTRDCKKISQTRVSSVLLASLMNVKSASIESNPRSARKSHHRP